MAVTAAPFGVPKILSIWSQGLGPIKRPLTTSFDSNIDKVLKKGIKPKLGENPTSRSLRKLPKFGTYEKPSPRRAAFLLVPKTADGRISYNPREKEDILSLKNAIFCYWKSPVLPPVFFSFQFEKMSTMQEFVLLSFETNSKMPILSFFPPFCHSALPRPSIFIISLLMPLMEHEYVLDVTFVASKIVLRHPNRYASKNV